MAARLRDLLDALAWEREGQPLGVRVRRPTGRLDYLIWPSRSLRLDPDDHGLVDAVAWYDDAPDGPLSA